MPLSSEEALREVAAASCEHSFRCQRESAASYTLETCIEWRAQNDRFSRIEAAINAGRVNFDPDAAERCATAVESAACNVLPDELEDCRAAFAGTRVDGQSCWIDEECVEPSSCRQMILGQCGQCVARIAEGQPCDSANAYNCDRHLHCRNQRCERLPVEGQPCVDGICDVGFSCVTMNNVATCRGWAAEGQTCQLQATNGVLLAPICAPYNDLFCSALPPDLGVCESVTRVGVGDS